MKRVVPTAFPTDPSLRVPADIGNAIRAARTSARLSIEVAAAGLGISRHTLLNIEQGLPSVAIGTVLNAAVQLGVALFMVPAAGKELAKRKLADSLARSLGQQSLGRQVPGQQSAG